MGSNRRIRHVDILSVLFGIGTWACVNGVWVELPLLVQRLPEGWNLPSYMSVVIQIANLGPLTYTLLHSLYPRVFTEGRCIASTLIVGAIATVFLSFFWEKTLYIFGALRSVPFLVLVFILAFVDCSSRVLFLPFMAKFNPMYLASFFIGEGLSGVIPSLFSLAQGVGGNPECRNTSRIENGSAIYEIQAINHDPRFPIEAFFLLLTATMTISTLAFYFLNKPRYVLNAYANPTQRDLLAPSKNGRNGTGQFYHSTSETSLSDLPRIANGNGANGHVPYGKSVAVPSKSPSPEPKERDNNENLLFNHIPRPTFLYLMAVQALVCGFANGLFPSIQSYSCLPYGNVPYHLAVSLSSIANPLVCFMAFYIPKPNTMSISGILSISVGVASYCFYTALESPTPPLLGRASGEALLVISWVAMSGLFTYVKVSVATLMRAEGKRGLFWVGAITQIGSATGALISFFVVNYSDVFQAFYPC